MWKRLKQIVCDHPSVAKAENSDEFRCKKCGAFPVDIWRASFCEVTTMVIIWMILIGIGFIWFG